MPRNVLSQSDLNDVRQIAGRCLGKLASVEPIPSQQNVVCRLRLQDGGRRILKMAPRRDSKGVKRSRSSDSVGKEPHAYQRLTRAGLPAPKVYCGEGADGRLGRAWFACDDLGRRTAADASGLSPTSRKRLYGQMGKLLARIHGTPADDLTRSTPLHDWHLSQVRRGLTSDLYRDDQLSRQLEAVLGFDVPTPATTAFCHGDYHAAQCIRRGGRLVAAVDWESAHSGDPGRDHAVFEVMVRVTAPPDIASAALQAYSEARPFFDRSAYANIRIVHAAALVVAFTDARRHAYARSAKGLLRRWLDPIAAAA